MYALQTYMGMSIWLAWKFLNICKSFTSLMWIVFRYNVYKELVNRTEDCKKYELNVVPTSPFFKKQKLFRRKRWKINNVCSSWAKWKIYQNCSSIRYFYFVSNIWYHQYLSIYNFGHSDFSWVLEGIWIWNKKRLEIYRTHNEEINLERFDTHRALEARETGGAPNELV